MTGVCEGSKHDAETLRIRGPTNDLCKRRHPISEIGEVWTPQNLGSDFLPQNLGTNTSKHPVGPVGWENRFVLRVP